MQQGSPEWHEWRRRGIGASEVPILMGESDFSTPLEIWKLKRGLTQPIDKESNFAMLRGTEWEPRVRALYELRYDKDLPPALVEHPDLKWARASLDGYEEGVLVLEIKYPGKDKHAMARSGEVPLCYRSQVQYQLFVTGAPKAHYVSFNDGDMAVVEVFPDLAYWAKMVPILGAFWQGVLTGTPPAMTERDVLEVKDGIFVNLCRQWKRAKLLKMQHEEMDLKCTDIDEEIERLRKALHFEMPHPRVECDGVKIIMVKRKSGATLDIRFMEASA